SRVLFQQIITIHLISMNTYKVHFIQPLSIFNTWIKIVDIVVIYIIIRIITIGFNISSWLQLAKNINGLYLLSKSRWSDHPTSCIMKTMLLIGQFYTTLISITVH